MALVTCPACGSLTIGERLVCLACQRGATDAPNSINLKSRPLDTRGPDGPSAFARSPLVQASGQIEADSLHTTHGEGGVALPSTADQRPHSIDANTPDTSDLEAPTAQMQAPPSDEPHVLSGRQLDGPRRAFFAMGLLIVVLIAVALLAGPGRQAAPAKVATATHAVATRTPLPTATVTGTPLPTALPGYRVFADVTNQFVIQYPTAWQATHNDAGVAISDSGAAEGYVLQIYREDPSTCPSTDAKTSAVCWVDFFLSHFPSLEAVQNVQRLTGPTPAVTFGGEVWQTGVATFVLANSPDRIQIFATVHQGQPYLIAVLAPDDQFSAGNDLYFQPMLATFQFLTPDAS